MSGGGVLVVDDSAYARLRVRRVLDELGIAPVAEAATGDAALAAFEAARPGLVLIDQVMPGMDGLELARRLRARDASVRVVMLTVVSDPEIRELAREAGIEAVVVKGETETLRRLLGGAAGG